MLRLLRLLLGIILSVLMVGGAHAQTGTPKSKAALSAEIGNCFPDNVIGLITPSIVRSCVQDFLASWQQYSGTNLQVTTSYTIQGSDYGQMVISTSSAPTAFTLPAATQVAGFYPFSFWVNVQGLGAATLTPASGTIGNNPSLTLSTNQYAYVVADGTNWQAIVIASSGSIITGGAAGSLAYYQTTGTTLSALAKCNSGVYVTDSSGNPSCATALPGSLTIPSPTLSGTATGPDGGTWSSTGLNSVAVGSGTPSSGNFTNLFFTLLSPTSLQSSTATITGLTANNSPSASNDYLMYYSASDGLIRKCTVGACGSAGVAGVSSLNGLTGGLSVTNNGGVIVSTPSSSAIGLQVAIVPPQGRLTLSSGKPVMTANIINATSIFYDCFTGGRVPIFNGTIDLTLAITSCEIATTLSNSGAGILNNANVFDVWAVNSSGLTLCVASNGSGGGWASDTGGSNTTRGTGYTQLDTTTRTFTTNKNALTHCYNGNSDLGSISANQATYLGTFYTTSVGQTTWSFGISGAPPTAGCLCLWNAYNSAEMSTALGDTRISWSYASSTVREADGANNAGSFRVNMVTGVQNRSYTAIYSSAGGQTGGGGVARNGVCFDNTTSYATIPGGTEADIGLMQSYTSGAFVQGIGRVANYPLGFHFYSACENGQSGTTQQFLGGGGNNTSILSLTGAF